MTTELTYHLEGDYLIPDLKMDEQPELPPEGIGKYGRMRESYLKDHNRGKWWELLLTGRTVQHLLETDRKARETVKTLIREMSEQEGVNEALKKSDQMEWVRRTNNIRQRAEEMVLAEIVCR